MFLLYLNISVTFSLHLATHITIALLQRKDKCDCREHLVMVNLQNNANNYENK